MMTSDGVVKLLDFGIAKLLDSDAGTRTGSALMTPDYAAPEQANDDVITTATDVFALGAILHELLTDKPWRRLGDLTLRERLESLVDPDVTPPSRTASLRIDKDLDAICVKAMEANPEARYPDAASFADDVQRYLDAQPVQARPASRWNILRKWLRRNAVVAASAAAIVASLAVGMLVAIQQARVAAAARDSAEHQAATADATVRFLSDMLGKANAYNTQRADVTVFEMLEEASRALIAEEDAAVPDPSARAQLLFTIASAYSAGEKYNAAEVAARESVELLEALAPTSVEYAESLHLLAQLVLQDEGRELYQRSIAAFESAGEGSSLGWVRAKRSYSQALLDLGERESATAELAAALAVAEERHPGTFEHGAALYTSAQLALEPETQLSFNDRAAAVWEPLLKPVDLNRVSLYNQRALILTRLGQWEAAAASYEHAVGLNREIYGDDHAGGVGEITNLANLRYRMGEFERAYETLRHAQSVLDRNNDHVNEMRRVATRINLGRAALELENWAEAERLLEDAREAFVATFGDQDVKVAILNVYLAEAELARSNDPGRCGPVTDSLRRLASTYPPDNNWVVIAQVVDGMCAQSSGDTKRACAQYAKAEHAGLRGPDSAWRRLWIAALNDTCREIQAFDNRDRLEARIGADHWRMRWLGGAAAGG